MSVVQFVKLSFDHNFYQKVSAGNMKKIRRSFGSGKYSLLIFYESDQINKKFSYSINFIFTNFYKAFYSIKNEIIVYKKK